MAAEGADQIRVFDLFVEVADKAAAGQVGGCDFVERAVRSFYALATPGHDDDCLTWVDANTGTAFTGDSIQANGTPCQGVGFYRDKNAYLGSLQKLSDANLENIICGHDYDGIGSVIKGADEVSAALEYCKERVELYDCKIKEYVASGMIVEDEPVAMALKLIGEVGCGMPDQLFLALHTVNEHLK